jgi:uncharacterized protein (DUF58 family)
MIVTESSGMVGQHRSWHATDGLIWAVVIGWLGMLFGIVTGEIAPAAFAVSIMIGTGWAWYRRPHETGDVWLTRSESPGSADGLRARIRWQPAAGADGLRVRVSAPGHKSANALLAPPRRGSQRDVGCQIRTARTGRRPIFTLDHAETSAEQLFGLSGARQPELSLTVLPRVTKLADVPLPARLQGMTGPHESRRVGDGGDLRDVHLFTPGDRLRRIDWRTTARRRPGSGPLTDLYVRRTNATADATVMLVLDSRDDIGPELTGWNDSSNQPEDQPTSLDHARTAAASLARRYLTNGDRVGLEDLGRYHRPVPPAGGSRHLQRLITRIALSEPEGEPRLRRRPPRIPSGALVVLCSTFLDQQPSQLALWWHQAGHRTIAVDVLPEPDLARAPHRLVTGYRIVAMERADRLTQLTAAGIDVIRWPTGSDAGTGSAAGAPHPAAVDPATALAVSARRKMRT